MKSRLIKLAALLLLFFSVYQCATAQTASLTPLTSVHQKETIFGEGDPMADLPFPSGLYYCYEVTETRKDSVYTYEKDPETTIFEQAVAAIIVPCIHNDQFYLRFRDTTEYLSVVYVGVLTNTNGDFHTWTYESDTYGTGTIFISIAGGSINMVGGGRHFRFNSLVTPMN